MKGSDALGLRLDGAPRSLCVFCRTPLANVDADLLRHFSESWACWDSWRALVARLKMPHGGS